MPASPEEAFRCAEAAVTSGEADAVVAWLAPLARDEDRRAVSRLALACASRNVVLFGIRPASLACLPLTADLRVQFSPVHKGREILSRIRTLRRRTFINASASAEIPLFAPAAEPPKPCDRPSTPLQHSLFPELVPA